MIRFHKNTFELLQNVSNEEYHEAGSYCKKWFHDNLGLKNFFFTKSCTQSLELAVMSLNLPEGAEVIMPSYSFVSLANAVNNLGLKCVFVDCEKSTMNIDVEAVEQAISGDTKAVICINYGGVSCDFGKLKKICETYNLYLIEDNAHGLLGKYQSEYLGSHGDISCFSFDHLKNFTCYQGGGVSINNESLIESYQLCSEFGTNRRALLDKKVDFYEWQSKGTNSQLAPPLFSLLAPQLNKNEQIVNGFNELWNLYQNELLKLKLNGQIDLLEVPSYAKHNAHMFWIKIDSRLRSDLINFLREKDIESSSHYVPLHLSKLGRQVGEFRGLDQHTSEEASKILRLPLHLALRKEDIIYVCSAIKEFFSLKA